MLLRVSFRAPLNMISALGMCFLIHKKLSIIFLVAMVVLSVFLAVLITRAAKLFKQILLKVDAVNGVVQENVDAIRVVGTLPLRLSSGLSASPRTVRSRRSPASACGSS